MCLVTKRLALWNRITTRDLVYPPFVFVNFCFVGSMAKYPELQDPSPSIIQIPSTAKLKLAQLVLMQNVPWDSPDSSGDDPWWPWRSCHGGHGGHPGGFLHAVPETNHDSWTLPLNCIQVARVRMRFWSVENEQNRNRKLAWERGGNSGHARTSGLMGFMPSPSISSHRASFLWWQSWIPPLLWPRSWILACWQPWIKLSMQPVGRRHGHLARPEHGTARS